MSEKAKPYFYMTVERDKKSGSIKRADIYIFGDIKEMEDGFEALFESPADTSSYELAVEIAKLPMDAEVIVHINSYGGEVKEGLAIYNVLKSRENVTTICEGFAASAASLVFCAGKKRIMQPASLLFIHQAQIKASGSPDDLQKAADDLKVVTEAATSVYKATGVNIADDELERMMKAETWILPDDAVRMGFATEIMKERDVTTPQNSAMRSVMALVSSHTEGKEDHALMDAVSGITEKMDGFESMVSLARKLDEYTEKHPEALENIGKLLVTTDPAQAGGTNKGFFNFK